MEVVAKDVDGDGLFAQQVVVEKDDDYGYWIQTKGKDIWLRFSEGNFWKFPIDSL